MLKFLFLSALLAGLPGLAQTPNTHLTVPAASLVMVELSNRVDLNTGVQFPNVGVYQNGNWNWSSGAKEFRVPKGRTLVITDAQAWVLHESGSGTPAALELTLEHPSYGYRGSMAMFSFPDLRQNASAVQRQVWTSGFMVPEGTSLRLWVQQFYPASLMSMARILLHGYYL